MYYFCEDIEYFLDFNTFGGRKFEELAKSRYFWQSNYF